MLVLDIAYRSGFHLFGFRNSDNIIQLINFYTDIGAIVSCILYGVLALLLWLKFKSATKTSQSAATQRALFWTRALILVDLLTTVAAIGYVALTIYNDGFVIGQIKTYYHPYVALTFYVYFLCYMCYFLPEIEILSPALMEQNKKNTSHDYSKIIALIRQKIEQDRLYADIDLSVQKLADSLSIPVREISAALNYGVGKNFNDFVNAYRVGYFKQLLMHEESNSYSIEGLAYEAGFKSKASFYRAFKKETGQTPLQYQKGIEQKLV
ncbi:AraC family transcriptional regulator [uncultured Pontibacter sp.]|uniref:helix-turn-helix domain-containing protein n=1 Tax=uncultured Pontibacter sp. TaxID=453356 RepID=UPI0026194672|nr:AraC family transcriptional regulator [uncultured Pontibacter sp.]